MILGPLHEPKRLSVLLAVELVLVVLKEGVILRDLLLDHFEAPDDRLLLALSIGGRCVLSHLFGLQSSDELFAHAHKIRRETCPLDLRLVERLFGELLFPL